MGRSFKNLGDAMTGVYRFQSVPILVGPGHMCNAKLAFPSANITSQAIIGRRGQPFFSD